MFRTAVLAASLIACATLSAEEVRSRVVGIDAQRVVNCLGPPLSLIPLGSENHQRDAAGASPAHLEAAGRPHHAAVA